MAKLALKDRRERIFELNTVANPSSGIGQVDMLSAKTCQFTRAAHIVVDGTNHADDEFRFQHANCFCKSRFATGTDTLSQVFVESVDWLATQVHQITSETLETPEEICFAKGREGVYERISDSSIQTRVRIVKEKTGCRWGFADK